MASSNLHDNGTAILLVTGDITANGGNAQFELARRFLCETVALRSGDTVGLDIPEMGAPGYPEFITAIAPETVSRSQIESMGRGF